MSDDHEHDAKHGDDHGDEHDDAHDDDHDHFDGEPARELGPDEPHTPGWLPAIGAAIFALITVVYLVQRPAPPASGAAPQAAPTQAAQAGQDRPAAPQIIANPVQPRPGTAPAPNTAANDALKRLSPDALRDLQRRVQDAAAKNKENKDGAK